MLPYVFGMYNHVGMEFRLRKDEIPVVDYPTSHNWRQTGLSLIENILSLPNLFDNHRPKTMLQRIKMHEPAFTNTTLQGEYQKLWGFD